MTGFFSSYRSQFKYQLFTLILNRKWILGASLNRNDTLKHFRKAQLCVPKLLTHFLDFTPSGNQVSFSKSADAFAFEEDSSSDGLSPDQTRSEDPQGSARSPPDTKATETPLAGPPGKECCEGKWMHRERALDWKSGNLDFRSSFATSHSVRPFTNYFTSQGFNCRWGEYFIKCPF